MLVEMNTGYQCGDAYRACWSWTRRKNRPSRLPPPDAGDAGAKTARELSELPVEDLLTHVEMSWFMSIIRDNVLETFSNFFHGIRIR